MKPNTHIHGPRALMIALAMLLACATGAFANASITNVHADTVRSATAGTMGVNVTYGISDVPAKGVVLSLEAELTDTKGNTITLKPATDELTGDVGSILADGSKTIQWDAEKTLVREGKQGEYLCIIHLLIAGEGAPTAAKLNVNKYAASGWQYFDVGTITFSNMVKTGAFKSICDPTQGNNWQTTVDAGAMFYTGAVTSFPLYRGRNSGDVFKGSCDLDGCSAFFAIKDQGTPQEKIWANFSKSFQQTHSVNGTDITARYEFQFRFTSTNHGATKTLSVGNAGKPGQQIYSELSQGDTYSLDVVAGPSVDERSNAFKLVVPRHEFRYSYKGTPTMVFTAPGSSQFIADKNKANTLVLDGSEVQINKWLKFTGGFSIDTTTDNAQFTSNGSWSTADGTTLYVGQLDGRLDTSVVANSGGAFPIISSAWNIAGAAVAMENIRFAGGVDQASGLVMDVRVLVNAMASGCKFDLLKPVAALGNVAGVEFKGVTLSNAGWDITGFQVTNTGMTADPDFCIKNFTATYDRAKSKITAELVASNTLFDEMGGGFILLNGIPDAFHLLIKAQSAFGVPVPVPNPVTYAAVWTGFDVGMSNLQKGPLTISGTVFFANRSDWKAIPPFATLAKLVGANDFKLFELEGNITGNLAGQASVSGKARILGKGDVWAVQLRGKADITINTTLLSLGLDGGVDIVNLGGDQWLLSGTERGSVTFIPQFNITQSISADAYIPDLFKNNPIFTAINKRLGLPRKLGSVLARSSNTSLSFDATLPDFGTLGIAVDLSVNPFTDPLKFIHIQNSSVITPTRTYKRKGASTLAAGDTTYRTIATTQDMQSTLIQIWGNPSAPVSFVVNPAGTRFTATATDSSVIYLPPTPDDQSALWIIRNPGAGDWKLGTVAEKSGDSVHVWSVQHSRADFQFASHEQGRSVTAEWDRNGVPSGSQVDFYIDADNKDFNGTYVGTASETAGTFSYTLTDSLPECGYYIYAVRNDSGHISQAYSPTYLANPKAWLASPSNVHAEYTPSGAVTVMWDASADPNALQYEVRVTDASGNDSIYATVAQTYTMASFQLAAPTTSKISVLTLGEHRQRGCWSDPAALTVAGVDNAITGGERPQDIEMYVAPLPVSNRSTVFVNLTKLSVLSIDLYDADGRKVMPLKQGIFEPGTVRVDLDASALASGVYFVHADGAGISASRKIVVQK